MLKKIIFTIFFFGTIPFATQATVRSPDFNSDGTVNVADFLLFVEVFGSSRGDSTFDPKYDLNDDGVIDSSDYAHFLMQLMVLL